MLPPYARAILNDRMSGRHPEMILITIGAQWTRIHDHRYPFVFVPEADYLRGRYDFYFVAGVPVMLYAEATETETWLRLAGQLADHTAPVGVWSVMHEGTEVDAVMRSIRDRRWLADAWWLELDARTGWPAWWSDDRDIHYGLMREKWAAEQRALEGALHVGRR